jgi:PAS domain S-box-containing protein
VRTGFAMDVTASKATEEQLDESEAFNYSLLASITSQVAVADEKGVITSSNKSWDDFGEEMTLPRIKKGSSIFVWCKKAAAKGDRTAVDALELMKSVLNGDRLKMAELPYSFVQDGLKSWYIFRVRKFQGARPKLLLSHHNITEVRKAELQAKESNVKYKTILETTDEMIFTVDPEGRIMWANSAWKKNLRYSDIELTDINIGILLSAESNAAFDRSQSTLAEGKTVLNISVTFKAKNGSFFEVVGALVPFITEGRYTGCQGFFRNVTEIKRERAERIKAETRLQRTLDNMLMGCVAIRFDWIYIYVNDAAASQLSATSSEMLHQKVQIIYAGVNGGSTLAKFEQAMAERTHLDFEELYLFPGGVARWFRFQIDPIEDGIFVMSMDITKTKEAEENNRKNQELLKESQRIAHLGSWDLDLKNNVLFWSEEVHRIFETDEQLFNASYEGFLALVHPEDRNFVDESFRDSVANRKQYDIVHRLLFSDGRIKYLHEQAEVFYDASGAAERAVGTVMDITRRKEAEILLLKNEHRYHQVVENISDGLIVRDLAGRIVFSNRQFLALLGIDEDDLYQMNFDDIVAPAYRNQLHEGFDALRTGGVAPDLYEVEGMRKDGTRRWFELRTTSVVENDKITGTQTIIRDITRKKRSDQKLEAQNKELKKINSELDRFVYSTSHDLRAPLLSLLGLIDLSKNAEDRDEVREYLEMMKYSIERLDGTIREILTISQNSRVKLNFEQIDVKTIVNNLIGSIVQVNPDLNIVFEVSCDEQVPFFSDKHRVTTIVQNLMVNAVKYRREEELHPYVKVTFVSDEQQGVLSIEDNGEGIAAHNQERVFEMFYRDSEKSVGSGLGLYICKEVILKMGGTIKVASEYGKGSIFTVHLPNCTPVTSDGPL